MNIIEEIESIMPLKEFCEKIGYSQRSLEYWKYGRGKEIPKWVYWCLSMYKKSKK